MVWNLNYNGSIPMSVSWLWWRTDYIRYFAFWRGHYAKNPCNDWQITVQLCFLLVCCLLTYFVLFLLSDYHSLITFFILNSFTASPSFKCLLELILVRIDTWRVKTFQKFFISFNLFLFRSSSISNSMQIISQVILGGPRKFTCWY